MTLEAQVLNEALYATLKADSVRADGCLFLQPHDKFPRQWAVNALDDRFRQRLNGALGEYSSVSWIGMPKFIEEAAEAGYEVVFMNDPQPMYDWLDSLQQAPGVQIDSGLEGGLNRLGEPLNLIDGFLPFQAVGVNFQKTCDRMCWFQWSTGTGKTIGAEGTILWRLKNGYGPQKDQGFDVCFIFAKPNNLVGTRRKLKAHTGLEGMILTGTPTRRERRFAEIAAAMQNNEQPIVILNYEKFRDDKEFMKLLVEDHNVLNIWDEAPTKLRTRGTQIYRAANEIYYTSFVKNEKTKDKPVYYPKVGSERAKQMFTVITSATPIYNSPEDTFSVVRIADPEIFGSLTNFKQTFVAETDQWHQITRWMNLELMGEKLAHVTYQVDKSDPEIAAMFPEVMPDELVDIELHPEDQRLYTKLTHEYEKMQDRELSILSQQEILAAIGCLQMLINNPRGVLASAIEREQYEIDLAEFIARNNPSATEIKEFEKQHKTGSAVALKFRDLIHDDSRFTDRDSKGEIRNSKLQTLIDDVQNNDSKVIVFTKYNDQNLPFIAEAFDKVGITYVMFRGGMSERKRQEAIDAFKGDPSIKVFLSSDAGGDSIDLEEANLTINYDTPWTDAAITQRNNRQHRIISKHTLVRTRRYSTPESVEDRVEAIRSKKANYYAQIYKGTISEQASDLRAWSKKGLLYALTGREIDA